MAAKCAIEKEDIWHAIQQEDGDEEAIRYLAGASMRYAKERADVGTAVHHACEKYVMGGIVGEDSTTPYLKSYIRWIERDEPEFIAVEQTVLDPILGYAGTADMVVQMDGKTYIGDIKTGGVFPTAALQMVAYARATHHVRGDASKPVPWQIDGAFIVDLKPESFSIKFCDVSDATWDAFMAALTLHRFSQRKDVFGASHR